MSIILNGTSGISLPGSGNKITYGDGSSQATAYLGGFKNRIINGDMRIDQRNAGAAQTLIAGLAAYTVDRWLGYCAGANVTGRRISNGSGGYNYQYTGATGVTAISHNQRIESANSNDLAGSIATLSVDLANSLLTTVIWTVYYANTTDNFSSNTQIATGTFTVTSSITNYSTQISIPSTATTGIQVTLAVGSQTSGTWTIGKVQLEAGSTATSFDVRDYGRELILCQRYYWKLFPAAADNPFCNSAIYSSTTAFGVIQFPVTMRATPSVSFNSASDLKLLWGGGASASTGSGGNTLTPFNAEIVGTYSGLTAGASGWFRAASSSAYMAASAEL